MVEKINFTDEERQVLLSIARESIKRAIEKKNPASMPSPVSEKFMEPRATFVTIQTKDGDLRGCIGNIEPFEPLYASVAHNARNAALHDPRFPAVTCVDELDSIKIEVSVLSPPEPIDSYKEFKVGKQGIILRKGSKGAVFLPQVPVEQGWDAETTLTHLSLKAGLSSEAWKDEECKFKVFEATCFSE